MANGSIEKKGCKEDIMRYNGPYYYKMIFILLIKVIEVYMQFSIV